MLDAGYWKLDTGYWILDKTADVGLFFYQVSSFKYPVSAVYPVSSISLDQRFTVESGKI